MGMAYTKALKILKNAERALGFPLTERTGGREGRRRKQADAGGKGVAGAL